MALLPERKQRHLLVVYYLEGSADVCWMLTFGNNSWWRPFDKAKSFWGAAILKTLEIKWCLDYNLEGCCNLQTHSSTFFLCGLKAFILLQEDWMAFSCPHISWLLCKSYLIHCTHSIDSIVIMEILYKPDILFTNAPNYYPTDRALLYDMLHSIQ